MTNKWRPLSAAPPVSEQHSKLIFAAGDPTESSPRACLLSFSPLVPLEIWLRPLALCLALAELPATRSGIHISAAEYELCTISSEKEFNDASLVRAASTNAEWFLLSWLQGWRCWFEQIFDLIHLVAFSFCSQRAGFCFFLPPRAVRGRGAGMRGSETPRPVGILIRSDI